MIAHAPIYYVCTPNNVVHVYIFVYRALPRTESILFLFFEGSFLEVAIHSHNSRDIKDPSFFILELVLQFCPKFKIPFSQ